jgi:hypothetical protein
MNFTPDELGRKGEVKAQRLADFIDNSYIENLSQSKFCHLSTHFHSRFAS